MGHMLENTIEYMYFMCNSYVTHMYLICFWYVAICNDCMGLQNDVSTLNGHNFKNNSYFSYL